jgi:hypothetical protein
LHNGGFGAGAGNGSNSRGKDYYKLPKQIHNQLSHTRNGPAERLLQKEGLNASVIYVRGDIDINALLTGDIDYAVGLYAQPKYRTLAQLKGQAIGSLNPGGSRGHSPAANFDPRRTTA